MHDATDQHDTTTIGRTLRLVPTPSQPHGDPWAELAAHPEITLVRHRLPDGESGRYYRGTHAIVLDDRLDRAQERLTLWHELIHAERRDDATISDDDHDAVDREAHARAGLPYVSRMVGAVCNG